MTEQVPDEITREWIEEWMGDRFPAVVLHKVKLKVGFYDRDDGPENFVDLGYSWRKVYEYLRDNDLPESPRG